MYAPPPPPQKKKKKKKKMYTSNPNCFKKICFTDDWFQLEYNYTRIESFIVTILHLNMSLNVFVCKHRTNC